MSTRTKSFFDPSHGPKTPGQWHRPQNKAPLNEGNSNIQPPKPPIPATSEAKSKLKAFQFIPGHPDTPDTAHDKENAQDTHDVDMPGVVQEGAAGAMEPPAGGKVNDTSEDMTHSAAQLPPANGFPSTPGTRLSLEDLIGNYEEKKAEPENESPEEFVGWIPNSSSALLTPNRKRKRARSSSPSSCPHTASQRQAPSALAGTALQEERRTPEADPTAALWQSYDTGKQDDSKLPDFSHLLFQGSPRALETPARSAGFRRWASTGNDWPTTKSKRRKTDRSSAVRDVQDVPTAGVSGKSKFANMLKKVEESLATQRIMKEPANPNVRIEGPSSSSPLPETGAINTFDKAPTASPLETRQIAATVEAPKPLPQQVTSAIPIKTLQQMPPNKSIAPSNNLDHVPLKQADPVIPAPLYFHSKAPLPAYKRPSITRTPSNDKQKQQVTAVSNAVTAVPATSAAQDEFGDDFDLSAEDLEELVCQPPPLNQRSLYQIPQHPNPPQQQQDNDLGEPSKSIHDVGPNAPKQPIEVINLDDDDEIDEFGMGDVDEASFAEAEISATQAFRISPTKQLPRQGKSHNPKRPRSQQASMQGASGQAAENDTRQLRRYVVKQVVEGEYTNAKGRRCPEKVLLAEAERSAKTTAITLRDSWMATSVTIGNIVHVANVPQLHQDDVPSSPPGQITVSDAETSPLLVVHPDHMLSATTVADSFDCIRKAVLQDRIKATGNTSKAMVYGNILHEIFQQALSANRWDDAFLVELVERTVQNHVERLWELGVADTVLAVEEISAKMGELASWARIFVSESPSEVALVDDKQGEKMWTSISKLIAIEEHIWSPQYGLKGNVDATVQMTLVDHPRESGKKLIAPLEVKTGKTTQSPTHRAQTALYTLLLSDRYDVGVQAGILYYLESSSMSRIAPPMVEIRQMIQQRNRLAAYLHRARHPNFEGQVQTSEPQTQEIEESGLPSLLKNPFKCGRCYAQQSCFSYHALIENGSAESAGMVDDGKKNHALVWQEAVGHLQLTVKDRTQAEKLKRWFAKWDRLLTFEESDLNRFRRELWTMSSTERETAGRCFGQLVIEQDLTSTAGTARSSLVDGIEGAGGKINRFVYSFAHPKRKPGHSFVQGTQLTVGEPVVVSSESGQWALANGYIVAATKHNITVAVDRWLGNARQRQSDFDAAKNQVLVGIMTVGVAGVPVPSADQPPMLYRLDKDEFSNGLALVRNSLVTLMSSHPIHTKLRQQLILDSTPGFVTMSSPPALAPSQLGEMNEDQKAAVTKVLNAQDYALILGMPGTGKTTTIAHIIRALLAEKKSILLASFTHTAVDNILLKIRDIAPAGSILRLGVPAKINAQVQEFCQLASTPRKTVDEVEKAYMGCHIVATTCMGTNHALFNRRAFDVCIVDEASQITLPISLGPLLHARKFVLVGDHYQLPPLVQNKAASEGGLDVSLFRQLTEAHPEAVATLGKQYRMCEDIMSLSNALIYDGQLRCGNDTVAQRTLKVASLDTLSPFHSPSGTCAIPLRQAKCWIEDLVRPERKVVFASTDRSGKAAHETLTSSKNITNELEATLVAQLVVSLLALGVPGSEIGVITLYRSQLALIRQLFRKAGMSPDVEIDSADRFQGRDKECILLSMVRSNEIGNVGELLKDWRRVNVALTRARSKLIVLGSRRTLCNNDLLARFCALVDEREWSMDLPKDADTFHTFDFSSQAASDLVAQSMPSPSPKKAAALVSPAKRATPTPRKALKESPNASNRSPFKVGVTKQPAKVVSSRASQGSSKSKRAMEQMVFDIFEDIGADDI